MIGFALIVIGVAACPLAAQVTQEIQARLLTPLACYSREGTSFEARVIGPVSGGGQGLLPPGSLIQGSVREARPIGLGFKRERARLALDFRSCKLPDGVDTPCDVRLLEVDNAREAVGKDNVVLGVLAASHPHSWLNGVWYRPMPALFHRSFSGLSGATGAAYTRLAPNPAGAAALLATRLALLRLPAPEIEFPAGVDLNLLVTVPSPVSPLAAPAARPPSSPSLHDRIRALPVEVTQNGSTPAFDIINVVFTGTAGQIAAAFHAAGWAPADPLTPRTFARTYAAISKMKAYPTAPVSPLYYQGRSPSMVFQKSLNSVAKRHHIRIWEIAGERPGQEPLWAGAATHDTGIIFEWNRMTFNHRIDSAIDRERTKILNDLQDAGCLAEAALVERPEIARPPPRRGAITTDGAVLFAALRECRPTSSLSAGLSKPRRPLPTAAARRLVLEARHYLTRGNVYYWAYRGAHRVCSLRPRTSAASSQAPPAPADARTE